MAGGSFDGGDGVDKLLLAARTYSINGTSVTPEAPGNSAFMVTNCEQVGGVNGGLFEFKTGTLVVNASGIANFI